MFVCFDPVVVLRGICLQKLTWVRSKPLGAGALRGIVCMLRRCLLESVSLQEPVGLVQTPAACSPTEPRLEAQAVRQPLAV